MSNADRIVRRRPERSVRRRSRGDSDSRSDRACASGAGRCRRRHPGMRASSRRRDERRPASRAQGRAADRGPGRNHQPRLRFGTPGGGARGGGAPGGIRGRRDGRWHRVDVPCAVSVEGCAVGLPYGPRRGDRLAAGRGADLCDQFMPHGHHGRRSGQPLRRVTSRAGCVRGQKSASGRAGHQRW